MNRAVRSLLFSMTMAVSAAHAVPVTIAAGNVFQLNGKSYTYAGTSAFTYSVAKRTNDDTADIVITAVGGATRSADGATTTSNLSSLTLDNVTGAYFGSAGLGGERQVAPASSLMTGGWLDVLNLSYDASTKILYAKVAGQNNKTGATPSLDRLDFFRVTTATAMNITGAGTFSSTLSGIYLTTNGLNYINQALGLGSLASSITGATNFGTIKTTLTVTAAVPEASTMSMMLLGGLGLLFAAAARRRA